MKKMLVIILILLIIFIGMVIYRSNEKEAEIKIDEINKIESYMGKIYGWKEVSDEALPIFDDINDADEKWLWGTLRENIEDLEVDYSKIESTAKEIYGNNFKKEYPKEGTEFISYNEQTKKYKVEQINIDAIKDSFLLSKIEKNKNGYTAEIVEYLVDFTNSDNGKVLIKNLKEETIYELIEEEATDGNIQKVVKENIDKFTKKQVTLENEGEKIVVKKVERK